MRLAAKVVVTTPLWAPEGLAAFVEQCLSDGVQLVCVAGPAAEDVEEAIDWLVVGDGRDKRRFLMTTAHPHETLDEVVAFATGWDGDDHLAGESPRLVRL